MKIIKYKIMKNNILKYSIILMLAFSFFGCEKYLQEEGYSETTGNALITTEQGMEAMVNACYTGLRFWYGKEYSILLSEIGTDTYTAGNHYAGMQTEFTFYGPNLNSSSQIIEDYWKFFYIALNTTNSAIEWLPKSKLSDELKEIREGEVRFLRALYLWHITEIWGEAHFSTTVNKTKQLKAYNTPVDTFYNQIFRDLNFAEKVVPEDDQGNYGRVTKWAVRSMLARMYLYRKDYTNAYKYANMVIESGKFELAPSLEELYDINNNKYPDNKEVIWSVVYAHDNESLNFAITGSESQDGMDWPNERHGNNLHLFFLCYYQQPTVKDTVPVLRTLEYGRAFVRFMPTLFLLDLYNETIDERYYSTFQEVWLCNNPVHPTINIGDTGLLATKKVIPQATKDLNKDSFKYLIYDRTYLYDTLTGKPNTLRQWYPSLHKFKDPTRSDISIEYSGRDVFVFRLAEMYLIAAEAKMYLKEKDASFKLLEKLADNRVLGGNTGADLLARYGVNSGDDINIDFILDEKGREFAGEYIRWFDLKRTGKLLERAKLHNPDVANNIKEYHLVRPIPQTQLDAVTNKNEFIQNEGYN